MGRMLILWLLGVPISILIILKLLGIIYTEMVSKIGFWQRESSRDSTIQIEPIL